MTTSQEHGITDEAFDTCNYCDQHVGWDKADNLDDSGLCRVCREIDLENDIEITPF